MKDRKAIVAGGVVVLVLAAGLFAFGFVPAPGGVGAGGEDTSARGGPQATALAESDGVMRQRDAPEATPTRAPRATSTPAREDLDSGGENDAPAVPEGQRARIKTGNVVVQVNDFDAARSNLTTQVQRYGGYVSSTSSQQHRDRNQTWTTGEVTLRVPAENFSKLRRSTDTEGVVLHEDISTRDVTDQLVDLNARIETLEQQRDRLRELYVRTNDTQDLLAIQRQLSDVQTQIERLSAQRQTLRQQVAFSTLTVELREPRPDSPGIDPPEFHERPLIDAFLSSVEGVIVLARATLVTFALALPYLIVLTVLAAIGAILRRRWPD